MPTPTKKKKRDKSWLNRLNKSTNQCPSGISPSSEQTLPSNAASPEQETSGNTLSPKAAPPLSAEQEITLVDTLIGGTTFVLYVRDLHILNLSSRN